MINDDMPAWLIRAIDETKAKIRACFTHDRRYAAKLKDDRK